MLTPFDDPLIERLCELLAVEASVGLTPLQAQRLLWRHPGLAAEVREQKDPDRLALSLQQAVCRTLLGSAQPWPLTQLDPPQVARFQQRYHAAVLAAGWEFLGLSAPPAGSVG